MIHATKVREIQSTSAASRRARRLPAPQTEETPQRRGKREATKKTVLRKAATLTEQAGAKESSPHKGELRSDSGGTKKNGEKARRETFKNQKHKSGKPDRGQKKKSRRANFE